MNLALIQWTPADWTTHGNSSRVRPYTRLTTMLKACGGPWARPVRSASRSGARHKRVPEHTRSRRNAVVAVQRRCSKEYRRVSRIPIKQLSFEGVLPNYSRYYLVCEAKRLERSSLIPGFRHQTKEYLCALCL